MKVVHCKKEKYDIYIGRPSKWGNPFSIGKDGTREVTNKSGEYLRDINDYWWTCTSCHHKIDGTITNIKHMKKKLEVIQ